jgi:hypothetical protein
MDIVVYKVKDKKASLCTAALVDFETLRDEVDIDDESFYITTESEEELINTVLQYVKAELIMQLKQNILKNG